MAYFQHVDVQTGMEPEVEEGLVSATEGEIDVDRLGGLCHDSVQQTPAQSDDGANQQRSSRTQRCLVEVIMLGHMLGSVLSTQKLILYKCTTAATHTSDVCERIAAATVHDNVLVAGFFCTAIFVLYHRISNPMDSHSLHPPMLCMKDPGGYDR